MKLHFALALLLLGLGALSSAQADSLTFDFIYEFDGNSNGDYGQVTVTEVGGDLHFTITRGPDLGPNADLHEFYFNLVGSFTGLSISSTDPQHANGQYALTLPASEAGGAGFSFDAEVNFGNGSGPPGNGTLVTGTFTLSADQNLTLAAIMETSTGNNVPVPILFAAHFQDTSAFEGADSETVGAPIPLPGAAWLFGSALLGFPAIRRWTGVRGGRRT